MKFSTFSYFISDAFKSLKRNKTISLASMATVLATLFVFGVFLLTGMNVNRSVSDVESKVEIKVFLKDDISVMDQRQLEVKLREMDGVKDVNYESKEQAMDNFKKQLNGYESILEGYGKDKNPLPNSFVVKLENPDIAKKVSEEAKKLTGVEDVANDQELISTISSFAKAIRWIGLVLFIVLIGVSLFLIINTIKLTVYSRRREVGIMKFVGATDWFIRWPFVIEGITIGIVGAIFADVLLYFAYKGVYGWLTANLFTVQLISPMYVFSTVLWQFILSGAVIGIFGSIIALRKFLTV
ncbi:permease-like cell division protein FtsX [Clostridium fallax]|uniref:Cell division protein FtsX n=1 Tax=Clostridium fallax TaxID=1533 RepID=A0A1M4VLK2_9CLOT|nr:permease-like cell division protein FtsX [Clostridium fallax]SHE69966.1 cell division protein FtsX [Clostridium fallax]SQB22788.1 cell-division protein [Clostridium fallax]